MSTPLQDPLGTHRENNIAWMKQEKAGHSMNSAEEQLTVNFRRASSVSVFIDGDTCYT